MTTETSPEQAAPSPAAEPRLRVILGLGNPGPEYAETRHNVGFRVVAELCRRRGLALAEGACASLVAERDGVLYAQPQNYMNRSGYAARCFAEHRLVEPGDFLVVFDDVHLPLGRLRLRPSGSPGGHRGMESVIENLRSSLVPRLRLGVGPEGDALAGTDLRDFVLEPFAADEAEAVSTMIARAADACETWLSEGAAAAMGRFNG